MTTPLRFQHENEWSRSGHNLLWFLVVENCTISRCRLLILGERRMWVFVVESRPQDVVVDAALRRRAAWEWAHEFDKSVAMGDREMRRYSEPMTLMQLVTLIACVVGAVWALHLITEFILHKWR